MNPVLLRPGTMDADIAGEIARDEYHVADYVRPGDWVVDVGAYVGLFARHVHEICPDARLLCCEPMPANVESLRANAGEFAIIVPAAVVGTPGKVILHDFGPQASACHSIYDLGVPDARPIEVDGLTLAGLLERHQISHVRLLKLDCQGAEYEILPATPPDVLDRVDYLAMEVHRSIARTGAVLGEIPGAHRRRRQLFEHLRRTHVPVHGDVAEDSVQVWANRRCAPASARCADAGRQWWRALRWWIARGKQQARALVGSSD